MDDLSEFALDDFFSEAEGMFRSPPVAPAPLSLLAYAETIQSRRWCVDLVNRLKVLDFAFKRLAALSTKYSDAMDLILERMRSCGEQSGPTQGLDSLIGERDDAEIEARSLTSLLYYETHSVISILREMKIGVTGELAYIGKARDYFLAHPRLDSAIRNSTGCISTYKGVLMHAHVINTGETDPKVLEHLLGYPVDAVAGYSERHWKGRELNRKIVESGRRHEKLNADEKKDFRLFGVPEPDFFSFRRELRILAFGEVLSKLREVARLPL